MTTQTPAKVPAIGEEVTAKWIYKDNQFVGTGVVIKTNPIEIMLHKSSESNGLRYKMGRKIILNPDTDSIVDSDTEVSDTELE